MNDDTLRITRVELLFESETKYLRKILTGEEAEKWLAGVRATSDMAFIHSCNFPELNWEIEYGDKE